MRSLVMGVLNVTPDSFSDGGQYFDQDRAIERGLEMVAQGVDVIDVGGESSRPGAHPVDEDEECRRTLGVVAALASHVRISIDTVKVGVAEKAVEAGASLINDVSAGLAPVAAAAGVGWVAMHMQGNPATMQTNPHYDDVVDEVAGFLSQKADVASKAGVSEVWIDPGIGFGKTADHNLALLARLSRLADLGFPVLVGTSRKQFLGVVASDAPGAPLPVTDRLEGSLATAIWAMTKGAAMVRVHDVAATVAAARLVGSIS